MKKQLGIAWGMALLVFFLSLPVYAAESATIFQVTNGKSDIYFYIHATNDGKPASADSIDLHVKNTQKGETVVAQDQFDISMGDLKKVSDIGAPQSYMLLIDAYNNNPQYVKSFTMLIDNLMEQTPSGTTFSLVTIVANNKISQLTEFTADKTAIHAALEKLEIKNVGTSLYTGLMNAIELYNSSARSPTEIANIVVISDGVETADSSSTSREDLEQAIASFQKGRDPSVLFTIHTVQYKAHQDANSFEDFAQLSHGTYYNMAEKEIAKQLTTYIDDSYVVRLDRAALVSHGWVGLPLLLEVTADVHTPQGTLQTNRYPFVIAENIDAVAGEAQGNIIAASGSIPMETSKKKNGSIILIVGAVLVVLAITFCLVLLKKKRKVVPASSGGVKLHIETISGGSAGQVFDLNLTDQITLGRDEKKSDFIFQDGGVSSLHARLFLQDGVVMLEDMHSLNGTSINDMTIHNANKLRSGDVVTMGATSFRLKF